MSSQLVDAMKTHSAKAACAAFIREHGKLDHKAQLILEQTFLAGAVWAFDRMEDEMRRKKIKAAHALSFRFGEEIANGKT